jgi:2'-5' RNA ligase
MRLFVGIDLGAELAAAIEEDVARLRSSLHRATPRLAARWINRSSLHLTLVFIGHVPDGDAPAVTAALAPVLTLRSFDLGIAGFGTFPASGPLRVIWMGIVAGARELSSLHDEIAGRLRKAGCALESRSYAPHLTVARVKDARGPSARAARQAVRTATGPGGSTRVEEVTLFESRQSAAGSVYDRLLRIPLLQ